MLLNPIFSCKVKYLRACKELFLSAQVTIVFGILRKGFHYTVDFFSNFASIRTDNDSIQVEVMIASLKGNIMVQKAFREIKNNVNLEIIYLLHLQIEVQ